MASKSEAQSVHKSYTEEYSNKYWTWRNTFSFPPFQGISCRRIRLQKTNKESMCERQKDTKFVLILRMKTLQGLKAHKRCLSKTQMNIFSVGDIDRRFSKDGAWMVLSFECLYRAWILTHQLPQRKTQHWNVPIIFTPQVSPTSDLQLVVFLCHPDSNLVSDY